MSAALAALVLRALRTFAGLCLALAPSLLAAQTAAEALIHGASQLPRTELIELDYTLSAPDASGWEVALFFTTNPHGAWVRAEHVAGDVGAHVVRGSARSVHWAAAFDLPAEYCGDVYLHLEAARPVDAAGMAARDPLSRTKLFVDLRRFSAAPHHHGFGGAEMHALTLRPDGWLALRFFGAPPYRYGIEASNDLAHWSKVAARWGAVAREEVAPHESGLVQLEVPLTDFRFFRLVTRRADPQGIWPPRCSDAGVSGGNCSTGCGCGLPLPPPSEPPIMNLPDILPGPAMRAAGVHTFALAGAPTATWSVDRLVRDELAKTGDFTRTPNVGTVQSGAAATFTLAYVPGKETRYEVRATLPDSTVLTTAVQVFPRGQRASFMFESAAGKRVPVYLVVPTALHPDSTRALSIHHGLSRNGDDYCDYWREWAEANNTLAFAPTFDAEDWPGSSSYNLGNVLSGSTRRAEALWTFTIVEQIITHVLANFGLACRVADVWGHSAGGQFVHRMALFRPQAPVRFWMAANPGYWTLADAGVAWPHGTAHGAFGFTAEDLLRWSRQRMVVFRGTSDAHRDASLDTSAESDLQGPFRYVRAGTALARVREVNPAAHWRLIEAPFVGHSGEVMARHAQEFLAAHPWSAAGTPREVSVTTVGQGMVHYPREQVFCDGSSVTLRAMPEEGFAFAGWSGALSGTANPAVLPIAGDRAVTATFVPTTRRVLYWTGFDRGTNFPGNWTADAGWTLSTDNPSSGYEGPTQLSGASAYRNVVINRNGSGTHQLTLSSINTVGYTAIRVSWGARRSPGFTGKVTFQWSANGSTWNTISTWTDVENDSVWRRVADIALPAGAAGVPELRLRWQWTQSGTSAGTYRFDDPVITGNTTASTEVLLDESFGAGPNWPANWTTSGSGWGLDLALASFGYDGASGGANLRALNSAAGGESRVTREGIVTSGYRHVTVSWAARRTLNFSNPVRCQWSIDGTTWHDVAYREVAADAPWVRINDRVQVELPVATWNVPNLRLRWSFTPRGNDGTYRLDDVRVQGVAAPGSAGE